MSEIDNDNSNGNGNGLSVNSKDVLHTKDGRSYSITEYNRMLRHAKRDNLERHNAILKRYNDLSAEALKTKVSDEEVRRRVCEYMECRPSMLNRLIEGQLGSSLSLRAETQVMMLRHIGVLLEQIDDATHFVEQKIRDIEDSDDEYVEMEITEEEERLPLLVNNKKSERGMVTTTKRKKLPRDRAIRELLEDKMRYTKSIFEAIKSLLPQNVISNTLVSGAGQMSDEQATDWLVKTLESKKLTIKQVKGESNE